MNYTDQSQISLDNAEQKAAELAIKPQPTYANNASSGAVLRVKIVVENDRFDGDRQTLNCGSFEVMACDYSGPPNQMTLKGVSTSSTTSLRREDKNKPLEDTTLQQIAQEIASNSKLELNYEVSFEVKVDRADQILTPDLPYLQSLCTKQGVMLKVTDGKLVLFEEKNYEQKEAIASFDILQDSRVLSYQFSQNTSDTVNSIDYNYTDPKSGQQISQNFSIPNPPPTGQKLVINSRPSDMRGDAMRTAIINNEEAETVEVGSYKDISQISLDTDLTTNRSDLLGQAQREALGQARAKNKQEWIGSLELIGNTLMVAGVTVNIANAGVYSGQYMVDEATHTVSGGYKTSIKIHRVLQGY